MALGWRSARRQLSREPQNFKTATSARLWSRLPPAIFLRSDTLDSPEFSIRVNGFAIGKGTCHVSDEISDQRDAQDLFRVLEEEVVPLFYERDIDGLPQQWIKRMKNSINSLAWEPKNVTPGECSSLSSAPLSDNWPE